MIMMRKRTANASKFLKNETQKYNSEQLQWEIKMKAEDGNKAIQKGWWRRAHLEVGKRKKGQQGKVHNIRKAKVQADWILQSMLKYNKIEFVYQLLH